MMLIYFAGPPFSEAGRVFNLRLTDRLERANYEVFLPSAMECSATDLLMSADERREAMFELDKL